MNNILGIPFTIWGIICLSFSILYLFIYPKPQKNYKGKTGKIVLRWFHSLVWILLAASSFLRSIPALDDLYLPLVIAIMGLIVYIVFIIFFINDQLLGQKKTGKVTKQ